MDPPARGDGGPAELEIMVENVESALHQLYFDPDMEQKNVAQTWLTRVQASEQAWHFCWVLLGPDKLPEVQFFGATTLHTKISRHWSDLPSDQQEALRAQLLAHVLRFSSGPRMVLTRLCVALAAVALRLIPQAWPRPVADMVRALQPQELDTEEPRAHCLALLELLAVLPEEFRSGCVAAVRRGQQREALAGEWASVGAVLRQLLQSHDSSHQVKEKALRCLSSWSALDVPLVENHELLQECFAALSNPELFDTAVETIVTVVSQPHCQRHTDALVKLVPLVLGLYDQLKAAAQDGDMETSHGICRIAVAIGETHCRVLLDQVDHWQDYLALVNMILFCTGTPGHFPVKETSSSLTLTFWFTLQDDILSLEEEKQPVYLQVYRPVYFQLVDVLLLKARYPTLEDYASWSPDDKEQFRIYRVDISDTLMYVYELLGAELLSGLYDRLGRQLTDPRRTPAWQDTEALLFGFQSVAETADVNDADVIPGLIALMPRISISNVLLADTVMHTIGSLAEWLADHPVMLPGILPMVLQGLVKAELSVSSVSTLKRVCRECRRDLGPFAHDILTVSQEALLKGIHKGSQSMWLMQALGLLLSGLPAEEVLVRLPPLITPHVQQLDSLVQQEPSATNKPSIIHILGLLSSLAATLDLNGPAGGAEDASGTPSRSPLNPLVVVLQEVFPLIQTLLGKWLDDSEVVEAVCHVFNKSVWTLHRDFGPMVTQLSEMLGRIYGASPQASALNLARQLVHVFSGEELHVGDIRNLVQVLTLATLTIFQQGPRDHPDIAESFMQLHAQILKRDPDLYQSDQLDFKALFDCGIISLKFPESPTVKAASFFFTELLPRHRDLPRLADAVQADGKLLTETLLQAVGGGSPRSLNEHFSEVLLSLSRHCPALLPRWMKEALQTPGFPSAEVSAEQKHAFSQQLLREQSNRRRVKEMVKEFSLLCRGLQGAAV